MATVESSGRPGTEHASGSPSFSIVCLSRQDWDARLPTNRQQIMRRAARRGHEVVFVETGHFLGARLVRWISGRDSGLWRRLYQAEAVEPGIRIKRAANVLPWGQRFRISTAVNRGLTARFVRRLVARLPRPVVLWVYDPLAFGRKGEYGEDLAVYDVVDDYAEQAGPRRHALVAAADARAGRAARLVFATTTPLHDRHLDGNARTHLVRNVGDFSHFAPAADSSFAAPEVTGLSRPVLGFAGNFVSSKVDFELLRQIAAARPDATILLVGPVNESDERRLAHVTESPNVRYLGFRPYEDLPRYVAAFDVALIPYVENDYTRSCFPLKLFEYLAAGKPVIATGLPELEGMEPDVVVARGVDELLEQVGVALERRTAADVKRRVSLASSNTWETRTERLLGLVAAELEEGQCAS